MIADVQNTITTLKTTAIKLFTLYEQALDRGYEIDYDAILHIINYLECFKYVNFPKMVKEHMLNKLK